MQASTLCVIPSNALAYSLNITVTPVTAAGVTPPGYLGFLTIYPTLAGPSNPPPNASTLNNYLGTVVSNAAIVPAGDLNGSISAYPHDATDMIVDIPNLLSRASHVLPLQPGDVYTTGSPPGVGRIAVGDTVVVEAPGIGRMSLKVTERNW